MSETKNNPLAVYSRKYRHAVLLIFFVIIQVCRHHDRQFLSGTAAQVYFT